MRIIFDLRNVGLGNNGGSSTLVKSANALTELGHDILMLDSGKNQHTWNELKAEHMVFKDNSDVEDADFIIATGYKSVYKTMRSPGRFGHKCHWIRGWETWQMPEQQINEIVLKADTFKLVNSMCLQRKLKMYGVNSQLIRPGYDLKEITPDRTLLQTNKIVLGGLYSKGKHWQIKRTQWILDVARAMKKKYPNVELWMFGNSKCSHDIVDRYYKKPSIEEKNYFYNNISIWLSPAMQEGLHMPPAEAMMAGRPVVGTNADMSGTEDYLFHMKTGLVANNNFDSFLSKVRTLIIDPDLCNKLGARGRLQVEKIGSRKQNMKKLVSYFMGIIS